MLSFASSGACLTNDHILLRERRVLFLVPLQVGPILSLSLRFQPVTEDSVDTSCLADVARECVCTALFVTAPL